MTQVLPNASEGITYYLVF